MPGFESRGFELKECSPDMNLVRGRNAAGKSTAARAVQKLLWPTKATKDDQITGQFEYSEKEWHADLKSKKIQYDISGANVESPVSCPAEFSKCYYLHLNDLATDEQTDLAKEINKQISGGYDLQKLAKDLDYADKSPSAGLKVAKSLQSENDALTAAQTSLQKSVNDAARLDKLEAELNEADDAAKRMDILKAAVELAENRDILAEKQAQVDSFDPRIQKLQGNEQKRTDELNEELKSENAGLDEAKSKIKRYSNDIEQTNLPGGGVPDSVLNTLDERARSLITKQERINTLQAQCKEAAAAVTESRKHIGDDVTDEQLEQITVTGNWSQQSEVARKAGVCQAAIESFKSIENWLRSKLSNHENNTPSTESLNTGIIRLHDWLEQATTAKRSSLPIWIFLALAAISIICAMFSLAVHAVIAMIITTIVGIKAFRTTTSLPKQPHKEYQSSGLPQPDSWTNKSVLAVLKTLREQLRMAEYDRDLQIKLNENKSGLDKAEEEKAEVVQQIEKLRENLGASPDTDEAGLLLLAEAIKNWRDARTEQCKAEAALQAAEAEYNELINEINAAAKPYTTETCQDSESADGMIKDLKDRATRYRDAVREKAHFEQYEDDATKKIKQIESKIDELFNNIEIQKDDQQTLTQLLVLLSDFRNSSKERDKAQTNAETSAKKLRNLCESHPQQLSALEMGDWSANKDMEATIEHLMSLRIDQLETEKGNQDRVASRRDEIFKEINQIEERIDQDKKSHRLEDALADVMEARSELRKHRDATYASVVGYVLVNYVEKKSREDDPKVLKRANHYLKKVTDNRYELLFADGRFKVRDEIEKDTKEVNELSDGTRVQLLLCVRLAFVEHLEEDKSIKLPLLFDETLASTDDERAPLLARTIGEICKQGRQVFYFTAQQDEIDKIKEAVSDDFGININVIDFDAVVGATK